jgi:prevent-host-death family protein
VPARKDVRPITYLKSKTADLVREVSEEGRAITITQNGEAKVVVMDVETYDRWRAAMALLKALAQGEADVERGRTVKQAEAFIPSRMPSVCYGGSRIAQPPSSPVRRVDAWCPSWPAFRCARGANS